MLLTTLYNMALTSFLYDLPLIKFFMQKGVLLLYPLSFPVCLLREYTI
jgi:hypothetical protein